jgi:signal peptidase I
MALARRGIVGLQLIADVLHLAGTAKVRVTGGSMLPCVLPGDILLVRREAIHELALGDIAVFTRDDRLFAHRVVRRRASATLSVITCGDALAEPDQPVRPDELLGRVDSIIRGARRVHPTATFLNRTVSLVLRRSDFLTKCLLWLLSRARSFRESSECLT